MRKLGVAWLVGMLALAGCSSDSNGGSAGAGGETGAGGDAGAGGAGELCPGGCEEGEYCDGDSCDAPGVCVAKPINCTDIYDPVCGCDGNTYGNGCEAALAGVRIDFEGSCPCDSNDECTISEYCASLDGMCDTEGTCADRPVICPAIVIPVCGCNGITYNNSCEASAAGVRGASLGECE